MTLCPDVKNSYAVKRERRKENAIGRTPVTLIVFSDSFLPKNMLKRKPIAGNKGIKKR
jgi:hypothetical protein